MLSPLIVAAMLALGPAAAPPQGGEPARPAPAAPARAEEGSPRAAVEAYFERCRETRFDEAARYLDLPPGAEPRGPELARRLKAVLDRQLWIEPSDVSDQPEGDRADGLGADVEQLGAIPGPRGAPEPVRMLRVRRGAAEQWLFSRGTVQRIDGWYERLPRRWGQDHLPAWLLRPGPRELLWWQWLALPVLAALAWLAAHLAAALTLALLARLVARTQAAWDDALVRRLPAPVRVTWWFVLLAVAVHQLALYAPAERFVERVIGAGVVFGLLWAILRGVDVVGGAVAGSPWSSAHPVSRALLPLTVRTAKVALVLFTFVAVLSVLGVPVTSLLAGVGIGGLALALAAQKTVENLFGSFSIGVDQPFREGDFVKVEDFVGTVETIGLRSTRFRTLDRTLITLPNGKLADMRVESYTARDRIRFACVVGLVHGTSAAQMRDVLAGLEEVLRRHPKIWPDEIVVRFKELGATSLDVEVMAWFRTADFGEFRVIRQEVLLAFMDVVEAAGTRFAFPTQTVHLETGGSRARPRPTPAVKPERANAG